MGTFPRKIALIVFCAMQSWGCSHQQKAIDIEIIDGCVIRAKGMENISAKEILQAWKIDHCKFEIESETGVKHER
jgi:hypothetical protein